MKQIYEASYARSARDYNYTDERNQPAKLMPDEVAYFDHIAALALAVTGAKINIYTRDHESIEGSRNALGLYWWSDDLDDQFITIDNYFIHECYRAEVLGRYRVFGVRHAGFVRQGRSGVENRLGYVHLINYGHDPGGSDTRKGHWCTCSLQ